MRILYITHQFFPYFFSGVERHTFNLARQMRLLGHSTLVLSAVPPHLDPAVEPLEYVYRGTEVMQLSPRRRSGEPPDTVVDPDVEAALAGVIRDFGPDLVHVVHPRYFPEARRVATSVGIPAVAHLHDFWFTCPRIQLVRADGSLCQASQSGLACERSCGMVPEWGTLRHRWGVEELRAYDAVISPSRYLIERFSKEGFLVESWHRIAYGVDYRQLAKKASFVEGTWEVHPPEFSPKRPMVIRFLGTILRHKGPHILLEAIAMLANEAPLSVYVHGLSFHEAEYELELKSMAAEDRRVSFPGAYAYEDLAAILARTDLVVVPSLWYENFPITAQTATGCHVPVAVSDLGGMAELVDEYSAGFKFPPGDSSALAALIERCLGEPERLQLPQGRKFPPSLEEEAVEVEAVYREICART